MTDREIASFMRGLPLEERQLGRSSRILMIGQAPSRGGGADPQQACTGVSFKKLCSMCSIRYPSPYTALFDRVNVFPEWPGFSSSSKGDAFPNDEAKEHAAQLLPRLASYSRVLLLGKSTAKSFGVVDVDWFRAIDLGGTAAHIIPHPSGANYWYNNLSQRTMLRTFVYALLKDVYPERGAVRELARPGNSEAADKEIADLVELYQRTVLRRDLVSD